MGYFGAGLYSSDFAMDLRATVGAVARLPIDERRIVEILSDVEPTAANDPNDEEHTIFWLVIADQFAKRGLVDDAVQAKALTIIDSDADITMLRRLGMKEADLRKRRKILVELRTRILAVRPNKRRPVLKGPQPLLMETGDVLVYPTCNGKNINPYYPAKQSNVYYTRDGPIPWTQNSWGAIVIIDCGRAFDYLAWYRPLKMTVAHDEQPSLHSLRGEIPWTCELPGTCVRTHFKKMELKKIGRLEIDTAKLAAAFPLLRPGLSAAVLDISIANYMSALAPGTPLPIAKSDQIRKGRAPIIWGIDQVLKSA